MIKALTNDERCRINAQAGDAALRKIEEIIEAGADVGDITELKTTSKDSVVDAINELYDMISGGD